MLKRKFKGVVTLYVKEREYPGVEGGKLWALMTDIDGETDELGTWDVKPPDWEVEDIMDKIATHLGLEALEEE